MYHYIELDEEGRVEREMSSRFSLPILKAQIVRIQSNDGMLSDITNTRSLTTHDMKYHLFD